MRKSIDGFYAAYFTAAEGNGFALFVISGGAIVGSDLSVTYDGNYEWDDQHKFYKSEIKVRVKPGGATIQGVKAGSEGLTYAMTLALPEDFAEKSFVSFMTPIGPVNARFEKLRDLEAA